MLPKTINSKTRHHYLPVFYLKRAFNLSEDKSQLTVYNNCNQKFYKNALTEINNVKNRYQKAERVFTTFEETALHHYNRGNFTEFSYTFYAMLQTKDNPTYYMQNHNNLVKNTEKLFEQVAMLKTVYPYTRIYNSTQESLLNDAMTQSTYKDSLYLRLSKNSFILLSKAPLGKKSLKETEFIVDFMNKHYATNQNARTVFGESHVVNEYISSADNKSDFLKLHSN